MPFVSTKKKPPGFGSLKSGVYFASLAGIVYLILSVSYFSSNPASLICLLTIASRPDLKPSLSAVRLVLEVKVVVELAAT